MATANRRESEQSRTDRLRWGFVRLVTGVSLFLSGSELPGYRLDPSPPPAFVLPVGDPVPRIGAR